MQSCSQLAVVLAWGLLQLTQASASECAQAPAEGLLEPQAQQANLPQLCSASHAYCSGGLAAGSCPLIATHLHCSWPPPLAARPSARSCAARRGPAAAAAAAACELCQGQRGATAYQQSANGPLICAATQPPARLVRRASLEQRWQPAA